MHSIQGVESLARTVLRDPVRVVVGRRNASSDHVTQTLKYCGTEEGKLLAFRAMPRDAGVREEQGARAPAVCGGGL